MVAQGIMLRFAMPSSHVKVSVQVQTALLPVEHRTNASGKQKEEFLAPGFNPAYLWLLQPFVM